MKVLVTSARMPFALAIMRRLARRPRGAFLRHLRRGAGEPFSRGGVTLVTNFGPLAGRVRIEDIHPTPEQPWLVQEFVDGPMVCTYSTLHGGRVTSHCMYRAPRQFHHSTGSQFESIDGTNSLRAVEKLGAEHQEEAVRALRA